MNRVTIADARAELDALVDCVADDGRRIILTRDGKELAAIVHVDDARWLQEIEDRDDLEAARAAIAEAEEKGTIPWDQIEARLNR